MDKPPGGPTDIADASLLFGDDDDQGPSSPGTPTPNPPEVGGYDLDPSTEAPRKPRSRPTLPIDDDAPRRAVDGLEKFRPSTSSGAESSESVSQVWTRGAEWGPDLVRLSIAVIVYLALVYMTFNLDTLGLWVMVIVVGFLALLVIAYPILITLERPVRVTPEQALKDYLGSLNHLRPHYRRMWLLLSDAGKSQFTDFSEFRTYWTEKRAEWKAKAAKAELGSKVAVQVEDFRTEGKSAGVARIEGTGAVIVAAGESSTPIHQVRGKFRFVRAQDRMWYLDDSRMPAG